MGFHIVWLSICFGGFLFVFFSQQQKHHRDRSDTGWVFPALWGVIVVAEAAHDRPEVAASRVETQHKELLCVCVREKCVGRLPAAVYCFFALLSVLLDAPSSSCILHLFEAASPSLTSVPSSSSVTAFFLLLHHLSLHLHSLLISPSVHPSSIPPSLWPASSCAAAAVLFF